LIDGFIFTDIKKTSPHLKLRIFQQEIGKRSVPQLLISTLGREIGVHHARIYEQKVLTGRRDFGEASEH
jgi:hypothetical protein